MNQGFTSLKPYPFERLRELQSSVQAASTMDAINLSIGEPQHPTPSFIQQAMIEAIDGTAKYPSTRGLIELRESIANWINRRFKIAAGKEISGAHQILPVNGTREALFAIAQCLIDARKPNALIVSPNPFYQIYEGAGLLAGAEPYFLSCVAENRFKPDFDHVSPDIWKRCELIYVCSPGNPTGAVLGRDEYARLFELSDEFNFVIVADECYSELYLDEAEPPLGLLQIASELGRTDYRNCLVMHSLSKRSNAPGLRSGFVAGDSNLIERFFQYRTYHGSAMPLHVQFASIAAWEDEDHVIQNRKLYREKFAAVVPLMQEHFDVEQPSAGFYLWPKIPSDLASDDIEFCRRAIEEKNVFVLPGQFLAREFNGENPGLNRLRIALVADLENCVEGCSRLCAIQKK